MSKMSQLAAGLHEVDLDPNSYQEYLEWQREQDQKQLENKPATTVAQKEEK